MNLPKKTIFLGDKWFSKVIRRVGFHKRSHWIKLMLTVSKDRILFHLTIHLHKLFFNIFPCINYCHRFAFFGRFTTFFIENRQKGNPVFLLVYCFF